MISEDQGADTAAIGYTDAFIDAGIAKLDAIFGKGYAREHPQALAGYVAACASNLGAFMTAAVAAMPDDFDLYDEIEEEEAPAPPIRPNGRRR